jgi:FkbM family methyltransferase
MASLAKLIGSGLAHATRGATRVLGRRTGARAAAHASALLAPIVETVTPRGTLRFRCASATAARQAVDFPRHEPDTRRWIAEYVRPGDHLWDVGANVGLYSLYAALVDDVTVTSFEPVASTFAQLTENIALTGVAERVAPLCVALSNSNGLSPLYLANTEPGTAMHALGAPENVHGPFEPARKQFVPSFRADDLLTQLRLPIPRHVKIDVDGHELPVLEGLGDLLARISTIWIEVEGEHDSIQAFLVQRGFEIRPSYGGRNRLFINGSQAS